MTITTIPNNKVCNDCKYSGKKRTDEFNSCEHPKNIKIIIDWVTGGQRRTYKNEYCSSHRNDNWLETLFNGTCGKRARWYEPDTSKLVTLIRDS